MRTRGGLHSLVGLVIPDFTEIGDRWTRHWREAMLPASLVALVAKDKMSFAPGAEWQYSNTGYVVLGMLLEKVSGRSYGALIESEFSRPLGLTHTRVCEDVAGANGQAVGYQRDGRSFEIAGYRHVSHWFGGGGLCSTVGDLARWNLALHTGRVLEPATYALMVTPRGAALKQGYGFGLMSRVISGNRELMHTGQFSGFAAVNAWYPDQAVSVTVLTNTAPVPTGPQSGVEPSQGEVHGHSSCGRYHRLAAGLRRRTRLEAIS
jgi:CubicO group peptidase (beta-lactamase class C family)